MMAHAKNAVHAKTVVPTSNDKPSYISQQYLMKQAPSHAYKLSKAVKENAANFWQEALS